MARSQYIYTVIDASGGPVLAAFTVKHEMVSWVERNLTGLKPMDEVWRYQDGGTGGACLMGTVEHVAAMAAKS